MPMQKAINVVDVFTDKQILRRSKWRRGLILDTLQHKTICHGKLEEGFCLMRLWLMLVTGWVDQRNRLKLGSDVFLQTTTSTSLQGWRGKKKKKKKVKRSEQFRDQLFLNFSGWCSCRGHLEKFLITADQKISVNLEIQRWRELLKSSGKVSLSALEPQTGGLDGSPVWVLEIGKWAN